MAIFVEGMTELIFLRRLLIDIAGKDAIQFKTMEVSGKRGKRVIEEYRFENQFSSEWYVLLFTCDNDEQVTSDVNDRYDSLMEQGFEAIIALRDVKPRITRTKIAEFLKGFNENVKSSQVKPVLVLAVMEIEAWFLAEYTHFQQIDSRLNLHKIKKVLNFDPSTQNVEARSAPSADVSKIYQAAGQAYTKTESCIKRAVNSLDMPRIRGELKMQVPSLGLLLTELDSFFTVVQSN